MSEIIAGRVEEGVRRIFRKVPRLFYGKAPEKTILAARKNPAEIAADIGIVSTHAQIIDPATPQRTAVSRLVAPTPITAPVIVCVVLTGMPANEAPMIEMAAAVSAQKPPMGCSLVIFVPRVLTIRQPPAMVPKAINV